MTITYCDTCGRSLEQGNAGIRVSISEFKAEVCDNCAGRLINYVKSKPWGSGESK